MVTTRCECFHLQSILPLFFEVWRFFGFLLLPFSYYPCLKFFSGELLGHCFLFCFLISIYFMIFLYIVTAVPSSQTSSILYTIIPCLLFALILSLAIIMLAWKKHKDHYYEATPDSPKLLVPRVNPKVSHFFFIVC